MNRKLLRSRRVGYRGLAAVESLEQRTLLAVFHVGNNLTGGISGTGTPEDPFTRISLALTAAKNNAGGDEIRVAPGNYEENLLVFDPGDVTLIGVADSEGNRPVLNGNVPIWLMAPEASTVIRNFRLTPTGSIAIGGTQSNGTNVDRTNIRSGSLTIEDVTIDMLQNVSNIGIGVVGLNSFTATNVAVNNGRVIMNDVATSSVNQFSVDGGFNANWVTELNINGLSITSGGLAVANSTRTWNGIGTPPVNAPAVLNASGVTVTGSGGHGLYVGTNITVDVSHSSFTNNRNVGVYLETVTASTLTNIDASDNERGFFIWQGGSITAQNLTANRSDFEGFYARDIGALSIAGGSFSQNLAGGFLAINNGGTLQLSDFTASQNTLWGVLAYGMTGDISASNLTVNDNGEKGIFIGGEKAGTVLPDLKISAGEALRNGDTGLNLWGFDVVTLSGLTASDNGGAGLNLHGSYGGSAISASRFDRNATTGLSLSGNSVGLALNQVTANDNLNHGIIGSTTGAINADQVSASGNGTMGLYIISDGFGPTSLNLSNSDLSGNKVFGLVAHNIFTAAVTGSHFDNNGPKPDELVDFAAGAWIYSPNGGGVSIENSTAIGNRVGLQSGAGILVVADASTEVLIRNVTISETSIHQLTTTSFGAGLAVFGQNPGLRIENSHFNNNHLTDSLASRSTVYSGVPMTIVSSQFLNNEGYAVDGTQAVTLDRSTVAGTVGVGVRMVGGSILNSTVSGSSQSAIVSSGALVIDQSTITNNATGSTADARLPVVSNGGLVTVHNSIVAGNDADSYPFWNAGLVQSSGYNLLSGVPVDWTGQSTDIVGDFFNPIDPLLAPLADNGGPTLTHLPLADSPVLEAGDAAINGSTDQRGQIRPVSAYSRAIALPDIGAVEGPVVNAAPTLIVNATSVIGSEGSVLTVTGNVGDSDGNITGLTASIGTVTLNADGTFVWTLVGVDDLNSVVSLTASDNDGATTVTTFTANVTNVAPVLGSTTTSVAVATRTVTLQTSVTDLGLADTHAVTINWGDGSSSTVIPVNGAVSASHAYASIGSVTITVQATDDDGGSGSVVSVGQIVPGLEIRNRELLVFGTNGVDTISFTAQRKQPMVASANLGGVAVQLSFAVTAVDSLTARLGGGDDVWSGGLFEKSQFVFGESGDDTITTGKGTDIVVGGDGNDILSSGSGIDLLFGGLGADRLTGIDGNDVLVAGRYQREDELASLKLLQSAWNSADSYAIRIRRMKSDVGVDTSGNTVSLNISQILDDAIDQLFGGNGQDWFLSNDPLDTLDLARNEQRN